MSDVSPKVNAPHQPVVGSPLLSVNDISVRFAGVKALTAVSFQVQPGQLFAVIGPNGAGKTSLFNVLSRVYQPVAGQVTFDGRDLLRLQTHQVAHAGIARTFQNLGSSPILRSWIICCWADTHGCGAVFFSEESISA